MSVWSDKSLKLPKAVFVANFSALNPQSTLEHLAASTNCRESLLCDVWHAGEKNENEYKYLIASLCPSCRFVQAKALKFDIILRK